MTDVMDEAREALAGKLKDEGEAYYVGAAIGDGSEPRYRGPLVAQGAIDNVLAWAAGAFAGNEATIATSSGGDEPSYTPVVTVTSGGPGEAPKVGGSTAKRAAAKKPAAKRASAK